MANLAFWESLGQQPSTELSGEDDVEPVRPGDEFQNVHAQDLARLGAADLDWPGEIVGPDVGEFIQQFHYVIHRRLGRDGVAPSIPRLDADGIPRID